MMGRTATRTRTASAERSGELLTPDGNRRPGFRRLRGRTDDIRTTPLRRTHGRPVALNPAHREDAPVKSPANVHAACVHRKRAIFAGIGRKLVECKADRLGGCRVQPYRRAMHRDPGPHEIGKMGELGAHQILDINSLPLIPDQQVLIGCKCLDAFSEALDKIFRITSRGLAGDCLHETEHILGAMIDLAHQKAYLLLVSFLVGHILGNASKQTSSIKLGHQGRRNKAPEAFAAIFRADHQFRRPNLRFC